MLSDYQEYTYKESTQREDKELFVLTPLQCAYYCKRESNFTCRSFDVCPQILDGAFSYRCLLSQNHDDNILKDPMLNTSDGCDHYSSDFNLKITIF